LKGIQISINDFGMGCSMKRHLRKLPATEIRIDKAFVRGMSCNPNDKEVVRKSVQVGHELGMKVVAHGVEETVQFEELCKMSCDIAVGTLFARPMSNEVFNVWLKQ